MKRLALVALSSVVVVLACSPHTSIGQADITNGRFVDVTCATACEPANDEASLFADHAVEIAAEWLGIEADHVGRLHLARDEDEYVEIESRIARGRFRTNLAFSTPRPRLSVVAVQPPVTDAEVGEWGLPLQTLRLAAHEASHLASYAAMPPPRRVPRWIEEGLAIHVETEARTAMGRMPADPGEDPLWSTYFVRSLALLDDDRVDLRDFLGGDTGGLSAGDVYALEAVIFRGLVASDPAAVREALRVVVATHNTGGNEEAVADAFIAAVGGHERIADALRRTLRAARPAWWEEARSLDTSEDVWVQHPFMGGALALRRQGSGRNWSLSMDVHLRGADPTGAVTLEGDDGIWGFVRVDRESVQVVRNEPREVLAKVAIASDSIWRAPVPLHIEVDSSSIRVRTGLLELDPVDAGVELAGPWGLIASGGGSLGWADVRYRSLSELGEAWYRSPSRAPGVRLEPMPRQPSPPPVTPLP